MSQETNQRLDDIRQTILKLRDVADSVFDELHTKVSKLLALVEIQKKLNEIARSIREGNTLPVRRINYNIKKLAEDDKTCRIRWSKMRKLNCPAIMFSTMAFNGLISLPDKQYECLMENVQDYVEAQELPCEWIARDQIRRVVASTPRRESTQTFLQSYHVLEIHQSQDTSSHVKKVLGRKRQRTEDEHSPSATQQPDKGEMQTGGPKSDDDDVIHNISETPITDRLWEALPKSDEKARQNSTPSPAISTSRTNTTAPNETQSSPTATSEIPLNNPCFSPLLQQHLVIEKASLHGIATVFDEYMCGAIRRDTVQSDGITFSKAAVTMDFPPRGLVDCLMSLDVHESKVGYLAMALFAVRVESVGQVRYVSPNEGVRLTPNPEITLKGVLDEAIIDVFGSEIYGAITACRMREKELEEGNNVTECVSMILTSSPSDGAIINLSLGLEGGVQIQNKLYT